MRCDGQRPILSLGFCSRTFMNWSWAASAIWLFSGESAPGMYCCM